MRWTATSLAVTVAVLVALLFGLPSPGAAHHDPTGRPLGLPVDGPVVSGFHATTTYGPGHRGIDVAVPRGTTVAAVAPGVVTFAGRVVDARWVTIDHGWVRTTVGPLDTVGVRAGGRVTRGAAVGTSGLAHGRPAVHFSARVGDRYVDPLRVGPPRVSLVPLDPGRRVVGPATRSAWAFDDRRDLATWSGTRPPSGDLAGVPARASPPGAWRTWPG